MPIEPCEIKGPCDYPNNRNAAIPDGGTPMLTVQVVVHVFCLDNGSNCALTQQEVDDFMCLVNDDYAIWMIQFDYETTFHNDSNAVFPADINTDVKDPYAYEPHKRLNIYVTNNPIGSSFARFPWSGIALAARGGVVLDEPGSGTNRRIPTHEIGHAAGLYHVFRGAALGCEDACYEYVEMDSEDRDVAGDFCSDTLPLPNGHSGCTVSGDDCDNTPWTDDSVGNWMSFTNDEGCLGEFTEQQAGRMHCWADSRLWGWIC